MPKHVNRLITLQACDNGVDWASTQPSATAAWRNCRRGDWLIWYLTNYQRLSAKRPPARILLCLIDCTRTYINYFHKHNHLSDSNYKLAKRALKSLTLYVKGQVSADELVQISHTTHEARIAACAGYGLYPLCELLDYALGEVNGRTLFLVANGGIKTTATTATIVHRHFPNPPRPWN